jgi:hypothetical protein
LLQSWGEWFLATALGFLPSTWVSLAILIGLEFLKEEELGFLDLTEAANLTFCLDLKDEEGSGTCAGPELRALVLPKGACVFCILISASAVRLRWLLLLFLSLFADDGWPPFLDEW